MMTHYHCGPGYGMTRWMNLVNEMRGDEEVVEHAWRPRVDIVEDAREFRVLADLPGIDRNSINITLEDGVLTLSGERPARESAEGETLRLNECAHGRFTRRFTVRETILRDNIHARFDNGVLTIHLPKAETAKPRKIDIEVSQN